MITKEQTRALETGTKAPQTQVPTPLGSMLFQAFAETSNEIGAQQASLYQQETRQVLSLGLSYDEQTKRLSSLRGKYTFGLMTNPGALIPTPSEKEYAQKMADETKSLEEKVVLDEIGKRITTSVDIESWQQTRDQLASTIEGAPSMTFQSSLNALNSRAKIDFTSNVFRNKQVKMEYLNRIDNNFLDFSSDPSPEHYDQLVAAYHETVGSTLEGRAMISDRLAATLERAGSVETVEAVIKKHANFLTPRQSETIMRAAQQREKLSDTGTTLSDKLASEARTQHVLGKPLGVEPRYIQNKTERENEAFLSKFPLSFVAPELIESTQGMPRIGQQVAGKLRDDLKTDAFQALNDRGANVTPSALTMPGTDGRDMEKYAKQLEYRLKQVFDIKNKQYKIDNDNGTQYVTHAHTKEEVQVLNDTYEASSTYNKARLALTEYRAIEKQNLAAGGKKGQMMDPSTALPFKDKDAGKLLDLGISDGEFMDTFQRWKNLVQEDKSKAQSVVMGYLDDLNSYDPSANNVYDDYEAIAMYAAANSKTSLLTQTLDITGKNQKKLDPFIKLKKTKTKYSDLIVPKDSPIKKNIDQTSFNVLLKAEDGTLLSRNYRLRDVLDSSGEEEKTPNGKIRRPLARLKPDKEGTSIRRFRVQLSPTIADRNAGIWYDVEDEHGVPLYIDG